MISEHRSKIARLEANVELARDKLTEAEENGGSKVIDQMIASHRESVQALQNSLTPAEIGQLSTLSLHLSK